MDDVREATLIKTSAELDFIRALAVAKQRNRDGWLSLIPTGLTLLAAIALICVCIVWPISCVVKGVKGFVKPTNPTMEAQQPRYTTEATPAIAARVYEVSKYAWNPPDQDGDGSSDCIDSALLFYDLYGPECIILWVKDVSINWNHVFVAVPNGYGQWLYLESTRSGDLKYMSMNIWGKPFYDNINKAKNITYGYRQLKNDTFDWRWY